MTDASTPSPTRRLDGLHWDEISGVDMPAHLTPGWMVMKSASGTPAPSTQTKEGLVPDDQINKAALDPTVLAYIEALEADVIKAAEEVEAVIAKAEAQAEAPAPADETDEERLAKAMDSLPEPVRKHLDEMNARAEMAEATARSEQDLRLTGEFIAKAAEFENLPGLDPETFGPVLRKAAEALGEETTVLTDVLKAADAAISEGALFSEAGSSPTSADQSDAYGKIEALAKAEMEADPSITEPQAIAKAAIAHPDLYSEYLAETTTGV